MISQREMRNSSGEVLRRVAGGESMIISNRGRPAAMLVPVQPTSRERLIAAGVLRPASRPFTPSRWHPEDLPDAESSEALLDQVRGRR